MKRILLCNDNDWDNDNHIDNDNDNDNDIDNDSDNDNDIDNDNDNDNERVPGRLSMLLVPANTLTLE